MIDDDPYAHPDTGVLKNKLGITDPDQLDRAERQLVGLRIEEGVPYGNFDLAHLQAIHRHLFQDVFEWAGTLRTVEITKGRSQFQFRQFIETGMNDVHRRLAKDGFLRDLSPRAFAAAAGQIIGDVNYVHPFREGNGRTQLLYLEQLADQAGHPMDLARINPQRWLDASRAAHSAQYDLLSAEIRRVLTERKRGNSR